jgi:methionine-rich copper-binding protein CopC
MTTRRFILYVPPLGLIFLADSAFAHAIVVASTPSPRQTVSGPELAIEIRFNSRVDPARSRLTLVRPDGASVVLPLVGSGPSETLSGAASGLENGRYRLLWQTLSVDGHITHGEIPFEVSR